MRHPVRFLAVLMVAVIVTPALLTAQSSTEADERQAFFDEIQAPNWLGTDIDHTPIKRQRGGSCWSFSTVAFLESEVLRTNEDVVAAHPSAGNLSVPGDPCDGAYEPGTWHEHVYTQSRFRRARTMRRRR